MAIVGPGVIQEELAPTAILDGASEYEYVTILNPLTDDFAISVAQDVSVNMPIEIRSKTGLVQGERDVTQTYGLQLKNPDFQAHKRITNNTVIKAGQTLRLRGNEAQVAVRQLVNELLQREGKTRLMADPNLRRLAEERIIIERGSVQDIMDGKLKSTTTQIDEALNQSNGGNDEQPFPGLNNRTTGQNSEASNHSGTDLAPQERRAPGRPKKA